MKYKILWCYLTNSNPIRIDRGMITDTTGVGSKDGVGPGETGEVGPKDGTAGVLWFIPDYSTQKISCYQVTEKEREILERDHSEYAIMSGLPENFNDPFSEALEGLNIMIYEIEPLGFHKNKPVEKVISFSEVESMEINKNFISF